MINFYWRSHFLGNPALSFKTPSDARAWVLAGAEYAASQTAFPPAFNRKRSNQQYLLRVAASRLRTTGEMTTTDCLAFFEYSFFRYY